VSTGTARKSAQHGWLAIGLALALACVWAPASRAAAPSTVRVPRLGGGVVAAYARLHAAGLRVSIPGGVTFSSAAPPAVARSTPASGRRVSPGSVVVLYLAPHRGPAPALQGRPRTLVVGRFVGVAASAAYNWVRSKRVVLTAYLGPLRAGGASGLLANYRVSRQRPGADGHLAWGSRPASARGAAVRMPMIVWAAQPPPTVQTGPPSLTGLTTGTVTGNLTSYGALTTFYFEYGATRSYGARTVAQAAPARDPAVVSGSLSNLAPATTYHYRLVAVSSTGTARGTDRTFTTSGYYQNAVYTAAAIPDPFVLDNDGAHSDYWAFATGNLFPIVHSSDLVHWSSAGTAMTGRPKWATRASDWHPWAPSVVQTSQTCPGTTSSSCYVMYYVALSGSLNVNCIGVATSPTPGGPYRDQGPLVLESSASAAPGGSGSSTTPIGCGDDAGQGNIDPSPFIDDYGQAYLYVSTDRTCTGGSCALKPTISVIPLASDLLHASGPRVPLFSGDAGTWEAAGVQVPTVEGPSVALHDGVYYLFYSGGSWRGAYGTGYATATAPTGPFTKAPANPFLAMSAAVRTPGGGDALVTGPHQGTWLVYAGRDKTFTAPRLLRLDPFSWKPISDGADAPVVAGPTTAPQAIQP
jgi:hypothetical protein